jgi:hypothetical protein
MDVKNPLLSKDTEMKVNITITLDPDIIAWLSHHAAEEGRTTSNFVNQHFRSELNQRSENEGEIHRNTE